MDNFNYGNAQFDYEPYPLCYIPDFFSKADYQALTDSYPSLDRFVFKAYHGDKYALSQTNNRRGYYNFLKENPCWMEFYQRINSKQFVEQMLMFFRDHNIDLGVRRFWHTGNMRRKRKSPIGRLVNKRMVRSRFDFAIMPANGGHILPHSDGRDKLITMVLSFIKPGEWDNAAWGGGTDVLKPKDVTWSYNHVNFQLPFEKVDVVKTYPFNPNQALLFIKTYNSLHSVSPMTGPATALRKTVTVNIEMLH